MTSGKGGVVACAAEETTRQMRLLRNRGMGKAYANEIIGFNARRIHLRAAVGPVQLTRVTEWTQPRQRHAKFLDANLRGVLTPPVAEGATHAYHQCTIRVSAGAVERDRIVAALRGEHAVGCEVCYPTPNHRLASLAHFAPDLHPPETEKAATEVISLPVHPSLSEGDLEPVVAAGNATAAAGA